MALTKDHPRRDPMTAERAIRILKLTYCAQEGSTEPPISVEEGREACRMGIEALELLDFADRIGPTLGADQAKNLIRDRWWNGYRNTFTEALRAVRRELGL